VAVSRIAPDVAEVTVVVENEGYLPTNITQRAVDLEIAVPVRAIVALEDAELISGSARTALGHIAGTRDAQGSSGPAAARRTLEYVVRTSGSRAEMALTVVSQKGGTVRRRIPLR